MENSFVNNLIESGCGKVKNYNKNDIVFNEGDECKTIGIVLNGSIVISTSSSFFNEFTISSLNSGDIFGENLLLSSNPYYLGTVYATKKTSILFINKTDYINIISKDLESYLIDNSNRYQILQSRTKILLQKSIKEKIMFFLISKSKQIGSNAVPINSKESLAKYLNVERPSLSRELANLKEEGIINYDRHFIYIEKEPD